MPIRSLHFRLLLDARRLHHGGVRRTQHIFQLFRGQAILDGHFFGTPRTGIDECGLHPATFHFRELVLPPQSIGGTILQPSHCRHELCLLGLPFLLVGLLDRHDGEDLRPVVIEMHRGHHLPPRTEIFESRLLFIGCRSWLRGRMPIVEEFPAGSKSRFSLPARPSNFSQP